MDLLGEMSVPANPLKANCGAFSLSTQLHSKPAQVGSRIATMADGQKGLNPLSYQLRSPLNTHLPILLIELWLIIGAL